jgi:hypothetical protein
MTYLLYYRKNYCFYSIFFKSNRLTLKGLNADTQYEITITPMTSGVSLEPMIAKQKTAPSPPRLLFPVIRSTSMEILIGQIEGAEDYRLGCSKSEKPSTLVCSE